jgi:hypothetical protein
MSHFAAVRSYRSITKLAYVMGGGCGESPMLVAATDASAHRGRGGCCVRMWQSELWCEHGRERTVPALGIAIEVGKTHGCDVRPCPLEDKAVCLWGCRAFSRLFFIQFWQLFSTVFRSYLETN